MSAGTAVKRHTGHRARLVLSREQELVLDGQAHAARTVWNLLHSWWTMSSENRRVALKDADAAIKQARAEIPWLAVLPAQAAQAVLRAYFQAWRNCWENRAERPGFKHRARAVMSVDIPQGAHLKVRRVHRRWGIVNVPKLGRVRFRWTKDLPVGRRTDAQNRITGARLVKDALGWHLSFRVRTLEMAPEPHAGPEVGIDAGIVVPLALSDGTTYDHGRARFSDTGAAERDKWLDPDEKRKLASLEQVAERRRRSRSPEGGVSHRLAGTYDQIKALRAKATRRHQDWQHKTTSDIAAKYGTVVVEDLDITNMVRSARGRPASPGRNVRSKAGLNRSISQEAWGRTVRLLEYKLDRRGGALYKVPAVGTSQRCSECELSSPDNRQSQAVFVCKNAECGWEGNADHNAARNVLGLFRSGHALDPAAGRAVGRRARRAKPVTAR